jgi:hypothetical protein
MINTKKSNICYLYNKKIYRVLKDYDESRNISYNRKNLNVSYTFMEFLIHKFVRLNIITKITKEETSKYIRFHKINKNILLGLYDELYKIEAKE